MIFTENTNRMILKRIATYAIAIVLSAVVIGLAAPGIVVDNPDSVGTLYIQEANAIVAGSYRASAVVTPSLQCTPVSQPDGSQVLDGTVRLAINGTIQDTLNRQNELSVRLSYTPHDVNETHLATRHLFLATDMPVEASSSFALSVDLPSHENTDHLDSVSLQYTVSSISGIAEAQTISFGAIPLPSCK